MPDEIAALGPSDNIWVVVPAFNEGGRLVRALASLRGLEVQIVVVDDGSVDATAEITLRDPEIWVLRHVVNCGQGAALQTGIDFALQQGASIVVTFDGDGQHSAEDIARLVKPIQSGEADVVLGSRFLGSAIGIPRSRWLLLKLAVVFTRLFSGVQVTDTHNGLRAFSRAAASRIRIRLNRMAHASEILDQIQALKIRYREVPVTVTYTTHTLDKGQSSWNSLRIASQLFLARIIR